MKGPGGPGSWMRVAEELVAGVHHALNNRLAALSAVGQVLEADLAGNHPLAGALGREIQRLESTVSLLRLLGPGDEGAGALQVEPVVDELRALLGLHHSLRDLSLEVSLEPGLQPVWAEPRALLRALLLLAAAAGARARVGTGVLELSLTGDARAVTITLGAEGPDAGAEDPALEGIDPADAPRLLPAVAAPLQVAGDGDRKTWALTLWTLAEYRRREARGGGGER